ncbi:hypothetical protein ACFXTO_043956 [Malus domestica]
MLASGDKESTMQLDVQKLNYSTASPNKLPGEQENNKQQPPQQQHRLNPKHSFEPPRALTPLEKKPEVNLKLPVAFVDCPFPVLSTSPVLGPFQDLQCTIER